MTPLAQVVASPCKVKCSTINANIRPTLWTQALEPDSLANEDCGGVRETHCVTPPVPANSIHHDTSPRVSRVACILKQKLQHQWREDMLDEEK